MPALLAREAAEEAWLAPDEDAAEAPETAVVAALEEAGLAAALEAVTPPASE